MRFLVPCLLGVCIAAPAFSESVVALRVLQPNQIINADEIAVEAIDSPGAFDDVADVIGLEAKRAIYAGQPVLPSDVQKAAVVERNQPVRAIYQLHFLTITSEARSLERGAPGDVIRIMNLTSRATITGEVQQDGSVRVLK